MKRHRSRPERLTDLKKCHSPEEDEQEKAAAQNPNSFSLLPPHYASIPDRERGNGSVGAGHWRWLVVRRSESGGDGERKK